MPPGKKDPARKRDFVVIIWIIIFILIAAFMLWTFYKQFKTDKEYREHIEKEENQVSRNLPGKPLPFYLLKAI